MKEDKEYLAFQLIAKKIGNKVNGIYDENAEDRCNDYNSSIFKEESKLRDALWHAYNSGGTSGGDCWGDNDPQFFSNDPQKKTPDVLLPLFETICPEISFINYKKITDKTTKFESVRLSEYYGNSEDYKITYYKIDELFQALKENNIALNLEIEPDKQNKKTRIKPS